MEKVMTLEEQVEYIIRQTKEDLKLTYKGDSWMSVAAGTILQHLNESAWINSDDRLPIESSEYIVCIGHIVTSGWYNSDTEEWNVDLIEEDERVEKWRPFPKK